MKPQNYLYKNILLLLAIFLSSSIQFLLSQNASLDFAAHIGGLEDQYGKAIAVDHEGNILATGDFSGTADFDPGSGVHNLSGLNAFFVLKLDDEGNFLWAHAFQGNFLGNRGNDITVDLQGNVYVTGRATYQTDFDPGPDTLYIDEPLALNGVGFILKLSPAGDLRWARLIGSDSGCPSNAIEVDIEGNVYTAGGFFREGDFDPDTSTFILSTNPTTNWNEDAFVLKLDSLGQFIWARQIGGAGREEILDMKLDDEGNIHLTGFFTDTADFDPGSTQFDLIAQGDFDAFVCKLDTDGQFVWAKALGSAGYDTGGAIAVGADGAVTISCLFKGELDADPGPDSLFFTTSDRRNSLIVQLDSSGNFAWASQLESTTLNHCDGLTVDETGNIYGTGTFTGITDFDPGALSYPLSPENGSAIFLLRLNSQGHLVWANALDQAHDAQGRDICLNPGGNIMSIGYFAGTLDVDPGPDLNLIMSPNTLDSDMYILKFKQSTTRIEDELEREHFNVYPNPTSDVLSADIQSPIEEIAIFDLQGRLVQKEARFPLSIASLESGVYLIRVRSQETEYISKFIKK